MNAYPQHVDNRYCFHLWCAFRWAAATAEFKIPTVSEMDLDTQTDVAELQADLPVLPCPNPVASGTLKCEACLGGCQLLNDIHIPPPSSSDIASEHGGRRKHSTSAIGNERAHYVFPNASQENVPDVILYRSGAVGFLYASVRTAEATQKAWSSPAYKYSQ